MELNLISVKCKERAGTEMLQMTGKELQAGSNMHYKFKCSLVLCFFPSSHCPFQLYHKAAAREKQNTNVAKEVSSRL